jgi:hypothetical protein
MTPDDRATLLTRVEALARDHPDLTGRSDFVLPYVTHVFRANRH